MRVLVLVVLAAGCGGPRYVPKVVDTEESRTAIAAVEEYRRAIESHDFGGIAARVSPDYRDCAHAADNRPGEPCIDQSSLVATLANRFAGAWVDYAIQYENVMRLGDRIYVDITIDLLAIHAKGTHVAKRDQVRTNHTLVLEADTFRIMKGVVPP